MLIEQLWTGNLFSNFNYLIACERSGEALAVDPLAWRKCLALAHDRGWRITQILNTHHHIDHVGGNRRLVAATGAKVLAHHGAAKRIRKVDVGLQAGDRVRVGQSVELLVLDTPGHTRSHICLLAEAEQPALFSGDTLFNAGAGNCHSRSGDPEALYQTFAGQLSALPENTRIFPGHDYLFKNLHFTLSVEPDNTAVSQLLGGSLDVFRQGQVTTLAMEREINAFFRLDSPVIQDSLRQRLQGLPTALSQQDVFVGLRELRNRFSVPRRLRRQRR